ncbi:hypothetical protein [Silvibacterium dinghuense]|uniref:Uncharacterized protein n=1 Tax=Silvibacterium dinghuense TaxID=1560006 RepID=A0A4V1NVS9_9BACT|nr:hypothetical protein [Silvibacterium dinghuense]RXS96982.1 hypothetical protein ESZ00_03330 [Silvibacterium dinghuense]GGG95204.1 hypothetical protein GCM10011586_07770 [Silvibacterium dinghuense]
MLKSVNSRFTVYVRLLNEGTPCSRPTSAVHLKNGAYSLLPTADYDSNDEEWEFVPGSIVFCEEARDGGSAFLRAEKLHPVQLSALVGLPLIGANRAGELATFSFGALREVQTSRGVRQKPDLALHLQCAWRLVGGDSVLLGSSDLYYPADGREDRSDFNWDIPGASRRDALMEELMRGDERLTVVNAELGIAGALKIQFNQNYCFEIMPNNSIDDEYWRLFKPGTDDEHLVIEG